LFESVKVAGVHKDADDESVSDNANEADEQSTSYGNKNPASTPSSSGYENHGMVTASESSSISLHENLVTGNSRASNKENTGG
jgi:hypothetical protein